MPEMISLSAEPRPHAGKGAARATRRAGRVPAIVYGDGKEPVLISLEPRELARVLARPGFFNHLVEISVDGATHRTLPRDVQYHPVTDAPLHLDFQRVGAGAQVTVAVPVVFINQEQSPGLRRGGILNIVRHDVEMVCSVDHIPERLVVDLTGLDIGDSCISARSRCRRRRARSSRSATSRSPASRRPRRCARRRPRPRRPPRSRRPARRRRRVARRMPPASMRLIVGLGNPGRPLRPQPAQYRVHGGRGDRPPLWLPAFRSRFKGELAEGTIAGERRLLLRPQTFMNLSGESVLAAMSFYKIAPGEIAVIHDELDLRPGKVRVKRGGGSAGHNGLRSIDAMIGADYWRVRIGIGHPGDQGAGAPLRAAELPAGRDALCRKAGRCRGRDDPAAARRRARCLHERGRAPLPGAGTGLCPKESDHASHC